MSDSTEASRQLAELERTAGKLAADIISLAGERDNLARDAESERHRQAAYLYSIVQSAEESGDAGETTDTTRVYDAGILYAASVLINNWCGDDDPRQDVPEYAEEIARRVGGIPTDCLDRIELEGKVARLQEELESTQRLLEQAQDWEREHQDGACGTVVHITTTRRQNRPPASTTGHSATGPGHST